MNGSGTLNGSRLPPNSPGVHNDSSYDAALKGASLAFQRTTPKQKQLPTPSPSSRHTDTRAIIAAASAASASRDHSRAVSRQTTGGSTNQGGGSSHDIEHGVKSQHLTQHLQPLAQRSHGTPSPSHWTSGSKQIMVDPHSPSFIAASLAASRNASPIRHQAMQSLQYAHPSVKTRRKHNIGANDSAASSVTSLDLATDTTSIPSTNALISMFEKKEDYTDPVKKEVQVSNNRKSFGAAEVKPQTRSPQRVLDPIVKNELSPSRLASAIAWERAVSPSASESETTREMSHQHRKTVLDTRRRPPTPPLARTKREVNTSTDSEALEFRGKPRVSLPPAKSTHLANALEPSPRLKKSSQKTLLNDVSDQDIVTAKDKELQYIRPAPEYPPPENDRTEPYTPQRRNYQTSPSSSDSFVSASSAPLSASDSPIRGRSRPASPATILARRPKPSRPLSAYSYSTASSARPGLIRPTPTSTLSVDSLASAMVASSLASSRITPTTQAPSPKPPHPRMQTPHMRQTLRQPLTKSDEEKEEESRARSRHHGRKRLGKLGGGNKHIHHEGARKRWREEITARERKRYEGVWASNRGLLLVTSPTNSPSRNSPPAGNSPPYQHSRPPFDQNRRGHQTQEQRESETAQIDKEKEKEQLVANVVARDIWARSRLPLDELAEVWDLVDRGGRGALDRAEFVVGMWLIDQRLRGRKLPRKVGESVWGSARGVRIGSLRGGKK